MSLLFEILVSFFLILGGFFLFVGSFGLVKLPEIMTRLHAPTKATTLGVGGTLIGSMFYFLGSKGALSFHEALVTLFLFLTAPVTAHFLAKAYMHTHKEVKKDLPPPPNSGWKTYEDSHSDYN